MPLGQRRRVPEPFLDLSFCSYNEYMDEAIYQTGYEIGKSWAEQDATPQQLLLVHEFGNGKAWVAFHGGPAEEFVRIVDPVVSDFMELGRLPSASFVAGFIDGARVIEPSSD